MENDPVQKDSSYTYWVRQKSDQAAPAAVPRKLSAVDLAQQPAQPRPLGSLWNQAGTWEEKCLTKWATERIKELLLGIEPLKLEDGQAEVTEISSCVGDATLVTVRNKKRVGYTYEITMKFKGDWREATVEGTLKVPEASYNDLDDLQLEVMLSNENTVAEPEKNDLTEALKVFLPVIRERLQMFEDELKTR